MNLKRAARFVLLCLTICVCAWGCGEDDDEQGDLAGVEGLTFDGENVALTDQINLRVDLFFSEDTVFFGDQEVAVLIKLPRNVVYVPDTARIDREGPDTLITLDEQECENGDVYLRFTVGREDLTTFDDTLGDSATMVLTVRGQRLGTSSVEARAQYNEVVGSCRSGIIPDATVPISVVPTREEE